jgi:solute carrier family 25 S-adenosylmethionine transporter 26
VRHGRPLVFWENMVCGAVSRSLAETIMHPANTMKTILQSNRSIEKQTFGMLAKPENLKLLCRGAGAQFLMSVPHGAINFAVLEYVRRRMSVLVSSGKLGKRAKEGAFGPGLDFMSSAISTISCSIISTPQMMITDNIMAGTYPSLPKAIKGLASSGGIRGFYSGWWPDLAGKIPSYVRFLSILFCILYYSVDSSLIRISSHVLYILTLHCTYCHIFLLNSGVNLHFERLAM